MAAAAPARKAPAKRAPSQRRAANGGTRAQRNAQALERARSSHARPATRTAPAPARRKSGAAPRPKAAPRVTRPKQVARPKQLARPLARVAQGAAPILLDRLLRGRAWVVIVGVLLAGIVFLNVSVLELNRGIASSDSQAAALERTNSTMRERVATLDSEERIQQLAESRGYVLPQPGDITYLRPNPKSDARLAATRIQAPDGQVAATPSTTTQTTPAAAATQTSAAPPSATPQAAAPQTATSQTATPAAPQAALTTPPTAAATP